MSKRSISLGLNNSSKEMILALIQTSKVDKLLKKSGQKPYPLLCMEQVTKKRECCTHYAKLE